jgi:hypothetical protein
VIKLDRLEIERFGGLAGIGLSGSRIRSRAVISSNELNKLERDSIQALFGDQGGIARPGPQGADQFRYRVTIHSGNVRHSIDVTEGELPESLTDRIHDELI